MHTCITLYYSEEIRKKFLKEKKMKRDGNIYLSYKREVDMREKKVPPKKGKGAKYNRAKAKRQKWL